MGLHYATSRSQVEKTATIQIGIGGIFGSGSTAATKSSREISGVTYEFPKSFSPQVEKGKRDRFFGNYSETDAEITIKARIAFGSKKHSAEKTITHEITVPEAGITKIELQRRSRELVQ